MAAGTRQRRPPASGRSITAHLPIAAVAGSDKEPTSDDHRQEGLDEERGDDENWKLPAPQHVLPVAQLSRTSGKKASTTGGTPPPTSHEDEGRRAVRPSSRMLQTSRPGSRRCPHEHQVREAASGQPVLSCSDPEPGPEIPAPSRPWVRRGTVLAGDVPPYSATSLERLGRAGTPRVPPRDEAERVTDRRLDQGPAPGRSRLAGGAAATPRPGLLERVAAGAQRGEPGELYPPARRDVVRSRSLTAGQQLLRGANKAPSRPSTARIPAAAAPPRSARRRRRPADPP